MATTNGSKSQTKTTTNRRRGTAAAANGRVDAKSSTAKTSAAKTSTARSASALRRKTSAASATAATARARVDDGAPKRNGSSAAPASAGMPPTEPAERVLDLSRLAWFRTQLNQMEQQQRERLVKVAQLTVIAIIFITFVLQNSAGVNVHFLLFSVNIRLIWVIFGCGVLGGAGGYLIGRPDKSLKALLPQKVKMGARSWGRFPRKAA